MHRSGTDVSEDLNDAADQQNSNTSLQQRQQLILDSLEENFQQLFDEVSMLIAMYPESRLSRITQSSQQQQNQKRQQQPSASTATEPQAGGGAAAYSTTISSSQNEKSVDTSREQQQEQEQQDELTTAISIVIVLNTTDAQQQQLSRIKLQIIINDPERFAELEVKLKSTQLAPSLRADLSEQLDMFVRELVENSMLTLGAIAARAEELLLELPVQVQAKHFGVCLRCAGARVKAAHASKAPQPIRVREVDEQGNMILSSSSLLLQRQQSGAVVNNDDTCDGAATTRSSSTNTAAVDYEQQEQQRLQQQRANAAAVCLMCGETEQLLFSPMLRAEVRECSVCFCEDMPIIFLECGCRQCVDCFQRGAAIQIGERKIGTSHGFFGVPCSHPKHRTSSFIRDAALIKLLDSRTLGRFHRFAFLQLGESLGAWTCAAPACASGGLPQLFSIQSNGLASCLFCRRASCLKCQRDAAECSCERLHLPDTRSIASIRESIAGRFVAAPPISPALRGAILFVLGGDQVPLQDIPLDAPVWAEYVDAHIFDDFASLCRERGVLGGRGGGRPRQQLSWLAVSQGCALNPAKRLNAQNVFPGSVVFLMPCLQLLHNYQTLMHDELDLWRFRREMSQSSPVSGNEADDALLRIGGKISPCCGRRVVHYLQHGCHHIGAHTKCCQTGHWCYVCLGPYPHVGEACALFCPPDASCGCPPCPTCAPGFPCEQCTGCPRCRTTGGNEAFV